MGVRIAGRGSWSPGGQSPKISAIRIPRNLHTWHPRESEVILAIRISAVLLSIFLATGCAGTMNTLGIRDGQLAPCPDSPNCVSSQATDQAHQVAPIEMSITVPEAQALILATLGEFERATVVAEEAHYIRAEFVSKWFRFVDDVEFYFPESHTDELVIHLRSASRVGYSDLGVNRKRVELIRSRMRNKYGRRM